MNYKSIALLILLFGLLFVVGSATLATSVDRMWISLEGYAGKTITQEITLEGINPEERSGFWYAHYKEVEGDNERMDITSWITIEPKDYTIKQGETKVFTVEIKIPKNAGLGLWGATSEEAGKEGHSAERRSYIVFKDALGGGNVYSGLLLPISVKVLPNKNPLVVVFNFVMQNILIIALFTVIIIMTVTIILLKKKMSIKVK